MISFYGLSWGPSLGSLVPPWVTQVVICLGPDFWILRSNFNIKASLVVSRAGVQLLGVSSSRLV